MQVLRDFWPTSVPSMFYIKNDYFFYITAYHWVQLEDGKMVGDTIKVGGLRTEI